MKRLIVRQNSIPISEKDLEVKDKIQSDWEEGKVILIPRWCDYEIIDDGRNEVAEFLDQEIKKRQAAAEEPLETIREASKKAGYYSALKDVWIHAQALATGPDNEQNIRLDVLKHVIEELKQEESEEQCKT